MRSAGRKQGTSYELFDIQKLHGASRTGAAIHSCALRRVCRKSQREWLDVLMTCRHLNILVDMYVSLVCALAHGDKECVET